MSDPFLLSRAQMSKIEPFFPKSHGVARGMRRVVSGIVCVLKHGLQWKDAAAACDPHKTLCNSFRRWTELRVFNKIFSHLTASDGPPDTLMPDTLMIDATHLKAHRTASSLLKGGLPRHIGRTKGGPNTRLHVPSAMATDDPRPCA